MKFLDPNKKPFDISDEAGGMGAAMAAEIIAIENRLGDYADDVKVSREDFAAVLCLQYLTAAARAAASCFDGDVDLPLDDFLENAAQCARYAEERRRATRRAAN